MTGAFFVAAFFFDSGIVHARFASAAGFAAALAGLGDGLLQRGHQVDDDRAGRLLLARGGLQCPVFGLRLDDLVERLGVVVGHVQVGDRVDAHRVHQRERAFHLVVGEGGLGRGKLGGGADIVAPVQAGQEQGVGRGGGSRRAGPAGPSHATACSDGVIRFYAQRRPACAACPT
ncbi:hypothetical protein ACFQ7J_26935 [Streptomyces sp. NPDC056501]|uniref:hypothetical protein n=1 Tax=Streptomyces sp. NPDC056501 TaxID=3345841 RepID=UPI0036A7B8A3